MSGPRNSRDQSNANPIENSLRDENSNPESGLNNNEIDFYLASSTNKAAGFTSAARAPTKKHMDPALRADAQPDRIRNPQVSLCEPIDEVNESESQQDKAR